MATVLHVGTGREMQSGVFNYAVWEDGYTEDDAFVVTYFPKSGRGCCDFCQTKTRASWGCVHVRAVKKSLK